MKLNLLFLFFLLIAAFSAVRAGPATNNNKHCVCVYEKSCRRDGVVSNDKCQNNIGEICCSESSLLG